MNNTSLKVVLVHGNGGGTGEDNWFPYIKTKIEEMNLKVINPTFPDNNLARESYWLPFLKDELKADNNTIIIGHSSGAVAAMRYAEKNKIYGSILVGASYTDLGDKNEKLSEYYDHPWDWKAIRNNQNWIIQFASTDDPYIPIAASQFIHNKLNTDYFEFTDQGHFGEDVHKTEFPELINALKKKLISG